MAETKLRVEVVTPERRLFSGEARMLVAKGVEGELGILPGHIPLVTPLRDGVVRLYEVDGHQGELHIAYEGGFLIVDGARARVLADRAKLPGTGEAANG
ncbi:MAG: ATP synthase F1 subunit epsilon [Clostridia bacterium]|nr:ATP synthase F1 subunit epsilon [Clostridia bacterium]